MRNLSKYFTGILAASLLVGCSDDNLAPDDKKVPTYHPEDAVYMQVTVKPTSTANIGSRGETIDPDDGYSQSDNGIEVGSEAENKIYNVMLIIADEQNNLISYALVGGLSNNNNNLPGQPPHTNNNSVNVNAAFKRQEIADFYNGKTFTENPTVHVFALCNYTQDMLNDIKGAKVGDDEWTDFSQKVIEYSPSDSQPNTGVSILSTEGGLYMANATIATKTFPKTAEEWDAYTTEKTPFDLSGESASEPGTLGNVGSIRVERGMARFDFADGSISKTSEDGKLGNQEYVVGKMKVPDPDNEGSTIEKNTLKVKLMRMALVNMSNEFYYLRHVAEALPAANNFAANLAPEKISLCEGEKRWDLSDGIIGNWVVDNDAKWKNEFAAMSDEAKRSVDFAKHFNFPLGNGSGENWSITPEARLIWYSSKIADVLKGTEDINDPTTWNPDNYDYRVWRYVTENTIPSIEGQQNGVTTGVVFKAQILPMEDSPKDLAAALNGTFKMNDKGEYDPNGNIEDNPILYVFDNVIYVKWTQIRAEALNQKAGSPLFNAVFGNSTIDADGKFVDKDEDCADALYEKWVGENATTPEPSGADFEAFRNKVVSEKIAIYQYSSEETDAEDSVSKEGGYFCYYYYWNRHNDNGKNGIMGPMEFQVVRNNVYKLAVTEISKLGHPRKTENDPDPEDPGTPDEQSNIYFKVRVEVLPWVVRVNNIEF